MREWSCSESRPLDRAYDDLPVHQTAEPIASVLPSRDFGERYRFVGWDADRALFFAASLGLWPNRQVIDGAFTFVSDGMQRSLLASRRTATEDRGLVVGPLTLAVVDPLRQVLVEVDASDMGLAARLDFVAAPEPVDLDRTRTDHTDLTRVTQFGTITGRFENVHALTLARVSREGEVGTGVLDVLALGPHESTGLSGWTD